jgi:hypothetical protein
VRILAKMPYSKTLSSQLLFDGLSAHLDTKKKGDWAEAYFLQGKSRVKPAPRSSRTANKNAGTTLCWKARGCMADCTKKLRNTPVLLNLQIAFVSLCPARFELATLCAKPGKFSSARYPRQQSRTASKNPLFASGARGIVSA